MALWLHHGLELKHWGWGGQNKGGGVYVCVSQHPGHCTTHQQTLGLFGNPLVVWKPSGGLYSLEASSMGLATELFRSDTTGLKELDGTLGDLGASAW